MAPKKLDQGHIDRRREAYKKQDWQAYDKEMKDKFKNDQQLVQIKFKTLYEVTGLTNDDLSKNLEQYALDLDKRPILEKAMYGAQTTDFKKIDQDKAITREQALKAIKYLQQ